MLILFKKELTIISTSVQGIVIPVIYLLITGLLLWVFDGSFNILSQGYSSPDGLFTISPVILLILIPALCMRSFAEEKKSGTEELLFTRPVRIGQIVFSKFLASSIVILVSIILTGIYGISVWLLGSPPGNIDLGVTGGGYIALIMTAFLFISIGEFSSAVADNQITALIIGIFFCTFFYWGFELISSAISSSELRIFIRNIGIIPHYQTLCEGLTDSRDIVYFIVWISIFLTLTSSVNKRSR
jgi:ABC-2 type transport system permease protein